jgi:hypothetical protein
VPQWAFLIAGWVDGTIPPGARMQVTNPHTGAVNVVPITAAGEFQAAFMNTNRQSVVAAGDEILLQLVSADGMLLMEPRRSSVQPHDLERAYLLTRIHALPKTRLLQNYPNPFNPETWIPFQLATPTDVTLEVYSIRGHLIRRLDIGHRAAGWYVSKERAAYWNGHNAMGEQVSSGVYVVVMNAGDVHSTRRLVVVK